MRISLYHPKKKTAEIEWRGKIVFLSEECAKKAGIDIHSDIPEELLPTLVAESEDFLCKKYLYSQLDKYFKTKYGYYKKLTEKGFSKSSAKKAVDKAEELGFIDDGYFVERYIERNCAKKGKFAIKRELLSKGVASDIIDAKLAEAEFSSDSLLALAEKLVKRTDDIRKDKATLYRKLVSRGFSYDDVNAAIQKIFSEDFD